MKRLFLNWGILLVFCGAVLPAANAQQTQPVETVQPNCRVYISFQVTANVLPAVTVAGPINNQQVSCDGWVLAFSTGPGISAVSIRLESAPAGVNATTPGTFGAFAGTIDGTQCPNPCTVTPGAKIVASGLFPWVQAHILSATGTGLVAGELAGYPTNPTASGGGLAPIVILNVTPCISQTLANLSGSGNTQLVAASGTTTIKVCQIYFSTINPEDIKLTYGTGSNCGTGTTDLTGLFKSVQSGLFPFNSFSPLVVPSGKALCMNQSVAQANGVEVLYVQN